MPGRPVCPQFATANPENQLLLWGDVDFLMRQMGADLGVSTTIRCILEGNIALCSQVRAAIL
jgi:hypothetical protein